MLICILPNHPFFFANDAYGKKKVRDTSETYIFRIIYIYLHVLRRDTGKRSINRTSGFNGEAVLSLACDD